jgi:Fe-S-cluster-containing dehydrogenase component
MKVLYAITELCNGCRLCETVCSSLSEKPFGSFQPEKARIQIFKSEEDGEDIPVIACNGDCPAPEGDVPLCVALCPTGALLYEDLGGLIAKRWELERDRKKQPLFKLLAPWKWPFPWKNWPFEGGER